MKLEMKWIVAAAFLSTVALPMWVSAHGGERAPAPDFSAFFVAGSLEGAQRAVDAELQRHPENAALQKLTVELRKNIQRSRMFAQETNQEMLDKIGQVLRQFYYRHQLFAEAEAVDRKLYTVNPELPYAKRLAETLLNQNKDQEAATLLTALPLTAQDRGANLLAALALARIDRREESEKYLGRSPFDSCSPQELMIYARVAARNGDAAQASAAVTKILQQAPAKESQTLRCYFQEEDFAKLLGVDSFQHALLTESQAGDSCAGCPNRGTSRCDGD